MNAKQISGSFADLRDVLPDQPWHAHCNIPDFMPRFPREKIARPTVQVQYDDGTEYKLHACAIRRDHGNGFFGTFTVIGYADGRPLAIAKNELPPTPVNVGPWCFHSNPQANRNPPKGPMQARRAEMRQDGAYEIYHIQAKMNSGEWPSHTITSGIRKDSTLAESAGRKRESTACLTKPLPSVD